MIQINLLPDVKLEYIKARRLKRTIIAACVLTSGVAFGVFVLMFVAVSVVQKQHLQNLDQDIEEQTTQLKAMPDIAKILTIQNQLTALPTLHGEKPVASRVFTYVKQLAPQEASITTLTVNFDEQTMSISGEAANLASVNKFADTLKFTSFAAMASEQEEPTKQPAFSEVVLSEFGIGSNTDKNKLVSYTITLKYAPEIFSGDNNVTLTIPNQVTTRSQTEKPANLFVQQTTEGGAQ